MRFHLLLCTLIGLTHSLVDFSNSALYDIKDFVGVEEVQIPKCDFGCLIYAATMGETFVQQADGLDPYASNLLIMDNSKGNNVSIANLAQWRDKDNKKTPLTIDGQAKISVLNLNDMKEPFHTPIVLYVIEKTTAATFSYDVYDNYYSTNTKITSQSNIVTILTRELQKSTETIRKVTHMWISLVSADKFRIQADPTNQQNSVTARLVGFDNALDNNNNGCPYAYKTSDSETFPGFTLMVNTPIISIVNDKKTPIVFQIDNQYNTIRGMAPEGYYSSAGWNGCTKPNNGGIQSFRSGNDEGTDMYILEGNDNNYNVTMTVLPNFDAKHKLEFSERGSPDFIDVQGPLSTEKTVFYQDTNYLIINSYGMTGDQGFIMRYSSEVIPKPTTDPVTAKTSEATTSAPTTSPTQTTTTSSGYRVAGFLISIVLLSLMF